MTGELAISLVSGLGGTVAGALVKFAYDWLNSASRQSTNLLIERDQEIDRLREELSRTQVDLSAAWRLLEILCLSYRLPLPEQVKMIGGAREYLAKVRDGSPGARRGDR